MIAGNSYEMITRQLPHFGRKIDSAVGQQNFGLADSAGVENEVARRGMARMIFVTQAKVVIAQWYPDTFTTPSYMHQLTFIGEQFFECCAGLGGQFCFKPRIECMRARSNSQL